MDVSPRDIEQVEFHDAWRGYNQTEVDDFLDQVGETVERLTRENDALRARLNEIEASVESARVSEELMKKTLLAAEKTAQETVTEAREEAQRILAEASAGLDGKKSELEASLASLQRFESETKQRLREVLEQQLTTLQALNEHPRIEAPSPLAAPAPLVMPAPAPTPDAGPAEFEAPADPEQQHAEAPREDPRTPDAIVELAAENSSEVLVEETAGPTETDTSLFDFEGADGAEGIEETEASMDDFRPFDDEAALQGRRKRGIFRRRVDDWA